MWTALFLIILAVFIFVLVQAMSKKRPTNSTGNPGRYPPQASTGSESGYSLDSMEQLLRAEVDRQASRSTEGRGRTAELERLGAQIESAIERDNAPEAVEACKEYGSAMASLPGAVVVGGANSSNTGEDVLAEHVSTVLYNYANQCARDNRMEMAFALWDAAYGVSSDPSAMNNKAFALRDMGRFEEAVQCLDQVVADRPDYPNACVRVALLVEAYQLTMASFTSLQYMELFCERGGDTAGAQALLSPEEREEPERSAAHRLLRLVG